MMLWRVPGRSRSAAAVAWRLPGAALALACLALAPPAGESGAWAAATAGVPAGDGPRSLSASARGDFEAVIREQGERLARSRAAGDRNGEVDALLRWGEAQVALGPLARGLDDLAAALALAEAIGDPRRVAIAAGSVGGAYLLAGYPEEARPRLERSLAVAREASLPDVAAITLNNLGNLHAGQGGVRPALDAYGEGERLALAAGDTAGAARAGLNAARLLVRTGDRGAAGDRLRDVLRRLDGLPPGHEHALSLVAVGRLLRELEGTGGGGGNEEAVAALRRAAGMAAGLGDARTESHALGHLGLVFEETGRSGEARAATRRALFLAQAADAPEVLYRWQWQVGRLQAAAGELDAAIAAYRGAVRTLQALRLDLPDFDPATGRSLFREAVGPVYLELADLLLRRSTLAGGDRPGEGYLLEARRTIELLKTAELENYFEDDCVADLQRRVREVDRLDARTAAV
ncbi:MAG TPA: tetratricopeptide repeat protein, partial [Geminicoccaceae bacterium]|nr:tetratricopeptide repeat protein [Geminicoccaceae bacterium]